MAGARLHRIGTIFSRSKGLIKSGAVSENEKPLWYDLYEAFPPRQEPCYDRKAIDEDQPIRKILYPEDSIRAKFYKKYPNYGAFNLNEKSEYPSVSKLFVEEYVQLQSKEEFSEEDLISQTILALESKGIYLERKSEKPDVQSELPYIEDNISDEKLNLSLKDMFAQSSDKIDGNAESSSNSNHKEPSENTSKLKPNN